MQKDELISTIINEVKTNLQSCTEAELKSILQDIENEKISW